MTLYIYNCVSLLCAQPHGICRITVFGFTFLIFKAPGHKYTVCQSPFLCPKIQVDENSSQKVNLDCRAKIDYI